MAQTKEEKDAYKKKWYLAHKEKILAYRKKGDLKRKDQKRDYDRLKHVKEKKLVIEHYGGCCACCGITQYKFLSVDHINGGGTKHRKEISHHINHWLIRNNFPEGYRVLCYNCNCARGFFGYCPHQEKPVER